MDTITIISNEMDEFAMQCPDGSYVIQNTDSGYEPIRRGDDLKWKKAAINGTFNYTACTYCNVMSELQFGSSTVNIQPDCKGNCVKLEDIFFERNECYENFDCGSCIDGDVMLQPDYGWAFDSGFCRMPSECGYELNEINCNVCNCEDMYPSTDYESVKSIIHSIFNGIKTNNCYDFCKNIYSDYNNDGYIDIIDIISMFDCEENGNCYKNECVKCQKGKANVRGNNYINIDDLNIIVQLYLNQTSPSYCQLMAADINQNGIVDLDDIYIVSKYLLENMIIQESNNSDLQEYKIYENIYNAIFYFNNGTSSLEDVEIILQNELVKMKTFIKSPRRYELLNFVKVTPLKRIK